MKNKEIFTEDILNKYADVLIWGLEAARKSTGGRYKKGDIVYISYEQDSLKLAEILHKKLLQKGMNVIVRMGTTPKMQFDFYDVANKEQLKFLAPWSKGLYKNLNGLINLIAPSSLTHLSDIDSRKIALAAISSKPLKEIARKREETGDFGWTLCMMPTEELAKQAKMSKEDYAKEIIKACYLDKKDPVKIWEDLRKKADAVKKALNGLDVDYFHIKSQNTDLKVTPGEKRKWLGFSGHNIPSFEIFSSPDWRGTEGVYYSDMPSFRSGNYVEGVRLTFKNGEVVKVEAKKGEKFVKKQLAMDKGASRLGELSFTGKRFSPIGKFMANTLFDENIGGKYGNCHIAVGSSFSDAYAGDPKELTKKLKKELGFNDSALHWDLINTEKKKVTAFLKSGEKVVIYENGLFKI
ncbi:MAG: aminopeptidase [bacterium]|nr:aminopeptidase [bacterium]